MAICICSPLSDGRVWRLPVHCSLSAARACSTAELAFSLTHSYVFECGRLRWTTFNAFKCGGQSKKSSIARFSYITDGVRMPTNVPTSSTMFKHLTMLDFYTVSSILTDMVDHVQMRQRELSLSDTQPRLTQQLCMIPRFVI